MFTIKLNTKSLLNVCLTFVIAIVCSCVQFTPEGDSDGSSEVTAVPAADNGATVVGSVSALGQLFPEGGPLVVLDGRSRVQFTVTGDLSGKTLRVETSAGRLISSGHASPFASGVTITTNGELSELHVYVDSGDKIKVPISDGKALLNL